MHTHNPTKPPSNPNKPQIRRRGRSCHSQFLSLVRRSLTQLYDSVSPSICTHACLFKDSHKKRVTADTEADTCSFHDITGVHFSHKPLSSNNNQPRIFSYAELYIGTHGFSDDQILGSGGFGRVYKATLPSDASVVAVKCLASHVQGNPSIDKTFAAELVAVAHLRHRNLVRLRGWCVHDSQLLLVYDYMPNHSLDRLLFIKTNPVGTASSPTSPLSFQRRHHIIHGLAAALFYLHEQLETQIIHRDVKTSNVMLDSHYNARLGDFGLARWLEHDLESLINPNDKTPSMSMRDYDPAFRLAETTRIGGTIGYLPPESFQKRYVVTAKSDVFSFGIVVLEVASGRRAVDLTCSDDKIILLDWVRQLADRGNLLLASDPRLSSDESYNLCDMEQIIHLGLLCTLHDPKSRPTMKWVLDALSGNILGKLPTLPSFKAYPLYISLATGQGSSSNTATTTSTITGKSTTSTSSSATSLAASNSTIYITAAGKTIFFTAAEVGSDDNNYNSDTGSPTETESVNTRPVENPFPVVETPKEISYAEIIVATNNFSDYNRVAEIDFGTAYQGFLQDHRHILVKRLGMKTCPALRARFSTELQNVGRLRHRNLVQLRGWCTEQGEMLVVYDFSANRLLSHLLFHKQSKGHSVLQWHHRYNIIRSLASAILYMHEEWEEQVIHRNITSSSVVVEPDMNPRLTNFALAEFLTRNEHGHHIVNDPNHNSVQGIFGYMSPEYMESGEANTAADIYSFGVVILEVTSGQMAVDFRRPEVLLVKRVREFVATSRPLEELADPQLDGNYDREELERLMKLGLACTLSNPQLRPSMRQIVSILDGNNQVIMQGCTESIVVWRRRNADSLSMARRIQALGIH